VDVLAGWVVPVNADEALADGFGCLRAVAEAEAEADELVLATDEMSAAGRDWVGGWLPFALSAKAVAAPATTSTPTIDASTSGRDRRRRRGGPAVPDGGPPTTSGGEPPPGAAQASVA
jgi:hypothetical protein